MQTFKRGKTWSYRFEIAKVNNQRKQKQKGGFATKKEAEIAGLKAENEYNNTGLTFDPNTISVSDYFAFWLNDYCRTNCLPTTIEAYSKKIKNHIIPAIGFYRLGCLTSPVLQKIINNMFNAGYSRNTLTCIKAILTGALDYAANIGYIRYNPAHSLKLPSHRAIPQIPTRKKIRIPATEEQLENIFKRFPEGHPAYLPFQTANRIGLRCGEVFALEWNRDFIFDHSLLLVNKQVQYMNGFWTFVNPKYDSFRVEYMDSFLLEYLLRLKKHQEECRKEYGSYYTRYFENEKGQIVKEDTGKELFLVNVRDNGTYIQPRTLQHAFRVIHYDLGYKGLDFHSMRHTHATELYNNGASLLEISKRLGHSDPETTKKYIHVNKAPSDETTKIVEKVYGQEQNNQINVSPICHPKSDDTLFS